MKNSFLILLVFIMTGFSACAQKTAPDNVQQAFKQKFPNAVSVKWDRENKNEWEAEFKLEGKMLSANFDNDGKWLETERDLSMQELPAAVKKTLDKDFSNFKVKDIAAIETVDLNAFEIDLAKGSDRLELLISSEGKVLKRQSVKEEDEEEND